MTSKDTTQTDFVDTYSKKVLTDLAFSTKSIVFGINQSNEWESTKLSDSDKGKILNINNYKCAYCDFKASNNQIHHISDNHEDNREINLAAIDQICHAWKHLGELNYNEAVITYLQNILPQNFNHLQRTVMIALNMPDIELQKDAQKILNWLGNRQEFIKDQFKTVNPNDFGKAIAKLKNHEDKRNLIFKDIFLLLNPKKLNSQIKTWIKELKNPIQNWKKIYKDIDKMVG